MKKMKFEEIVGFSHACDSTGLSRIALRAWPDEVHEHIHMVEMMSCLLPDQDSHGFEVVRVKHALLQLLGLPEVFSSC